MKLWNFYQNLPLDVSVTVLMVLVCHFAPAFVLKEKVDPGPGLSASDTETFD